jgi:uncharacterized membrane protein (UPF0127 family)
VLAIQGCGGTPTGDAPEAWVEVGAQRVAIELAVTRAEQNLGLGGRDDLDWGHGMYFVYDRPAVHAFWMKGMRFPIDFVWIRDGRIVDLTLEVPFVPGGNGPTVRPREAVDGVLELPAGYVRTNGWRIGDRVRLIRNDDATD